jgi:hypothetical protein
VQAWDRQRSAAIERLEAAEKVAGSVAKRLPGAVQKVPPRRCQGGRFGSDFRGCSLNPCCV